METKYYSAERNVQILVSLLKQHGIKKIIASPGTTNMPFVARSNMTNGSMLSLVLMNVLPHTWHAA